MVCDALRVSKAERILLGILVGLGTIGLLGNETLAQSLIVPDGTLGSERSQVEFRATSERITGGAARGINLFHSFREFNVGEGRTTYFIAPNSGIENILTRVTGSNRSDILGRLGVLGNANLFLLNPNGIVFGPQSSLDVVGSFTATTASAIQLGDRGFFNATQPQQSSLLSVAPGALLYNQIAAQGGRLVNAGNLTAGKDLTLAASDLELQGELRSGRDLTLQGQDAVRIRDEIASPFIARSERNLTIQGNQGVDILALSHPQTQIKSGGDLSLMSDGLISGDAHFKSGGNFQIRSVSGQLANFTSLYDPIISSAGNVDIAGGYGGTTGAASLLIEAQGSVRIQGEVFITTPDTVSTFVGSDAILSTQPGLIIRSGQTNLVYGGTNQNNPLTLTNSTIPKGITLDRAVRVQPNAQGGIVKLSAENGGITVHSINTSSDTGLNGGSIELISTGDITTTGSFPDRFNRSNRSFGLGSFSSNTNGYARNGGDILLSTTSGNITIKNSGIFSGSRSPAWLFDSRLYRDNIDMNAGGNGGLISLKTRTGSINMTNAFVDSGAFTGIPEGSTLRFQVVGYLFLSSGNGGAISFTTDSGNIFLTNALLEPRSFSLTGNVGNGGVISFNTNSGNISLANSQSNGGLSVGSSPLIVALTGRSDAGSHTFITNSGNISLFKSGLNSASRTKNGNNVSLRTRFGNIFLLNSDIETFSVSGNGGAISVATGFGDISLLNSDLQSFALSFSGNIGNGGIISLRAPNGKVDGGIEGFTLNSYSVSRGNKSTSGNGGDVTLEAKSQISNLRIFTQSSTGQAGKVNVIGVRDLSITDARISTSKTVNIQDPFTLQPRIITFEVGTTGQSGSVTVAGAGNIIFTDALIQSTTQGSDLAGDVKINSPALITFSNSQIISNTNSIGRAGSISVTAGTGIDIAGLNSGLFAQTTNAGTAGNITLNAPQITLQRDSQISTTATATSTNRDRGGSITLNASNLYLAGTVGVFAETQGQTPAGTLRLNPYQNQPDLNITLTPNSKISASTSGIGNGGDLILTAPRSIAISGPGQLAVETTGSGNGGNITLSAPQVTLDNGVTLSALSSKQGTAGNITIQANRFLKTNNANITTTAQSSGGDIQIFAGDIRFHGDSDITTNVINGSGGNINLTATSILALDDTDILSFAQQGKGGNITLNTRAFFGQNYRPAPFGTDPATLDGNDRVDINASGSLSSGTITTPDTSFIQNSLNQLPKDSIDTTKLLSQTCLVRKDKPEGTFYIVGAGGLPNRPGDLSPAQYPTNTIQPTQTANRPWQRGDPIVEPTGFYQLANGRLVMSRECSLEPIAQP